MQHILLMLFGYLSGSLPVGKLVGTLHGVDIQKRGSGNIGFANVQRVLGWRAGLATLAADIAKGALPVVITSHSLGEPYAFWVGMAAIAGHVFPVWLKFHGGKGVATGLGAVSVLAPLAAAVGAAIYVITRLLVHNSARSSLTGIVGVLVTGCWLDPARWWQYVLLLVIALYTLRHNIRGTVPDYDI